MKIYDKASFIGGLSFAGMFFVLWYFDTVKTLWLAAIILAVKNFNMAFSKTANERNQIRTEHFDEVGSKLYGKFYQCKVNLPWIFTITFLGTAIFLQYVMEYWLPIEVYGIFIILLIVFAVYAFCVQRNIVEHIDAHWGIDGDKAK